MKDKVVIERRPTNIFDMRAMANDERRTAMERRKAERAEARKDGALIGTLSTVGFDRAKSFLTQKKRSSACNSYRSSIF